MEALISPQSHKQNVQMTSRKVSPRSSFKDLWFIVKEGSLADLDSALNQLKKIGGNINSRNAFGLTPLHIATWRNHIPIIRRLLLAGADPDARDGESGWSSLHRALHFGHLAVASILLQSGASITLEDSKSRTPVDLLYGPVLQAIVDQKDSVDTEVFSWGSGTNYQLGTGNAHLQKLPCKVDALHGSNVKLVSAAKFHSIAVTDSGDVYTWGFGRGGRLGHPDFDIHSGQAAVITPRQLNFGLGARRVKAIAAAKHHTVLATQNGEVFTWGSNREGQLGYTVDTQPTPRRVSSLRSRIVAVAAANKHTAVVSDSGEVFTWGCNREGQLGYGTSNSASNYTPRLVEYLKGKVFTGVAAAKYHTIVLGSEGEVYTWGHRLVTPRRVLIARNLKKSGSSPLKFHRMERLHVASIAAGMVHSLALTDNGTLFYWVSSDPDLRCQQVYSLSGKNVVSISAGKYWSAFATTTGDVYMWDGKEGKDKPPTITRLHGIKKATSVSVGETHFLVVASLYHPIYPPSMVKFLSSSKLQFGDDVEELDGDFMFNDTESDDMSKSIHQDESGQRAVPSLKSLCEKMAAENLVEPRNAIQMLEIADSLGAEDLRKHCEDIAIHNLDYILTVSSHAFVNSSLEILANLENSLDLRSSEPWSYRRLPTPTATIPLVINSEEENRECDIPRTRDNHKNVSTIRSGDKKSDFFLHPEDDPNQGVLREVRALRKKLQQIEMLEEKQSNGHVLDDQQLAKLQTRLALEASLAELGVPVETSPEKASSMLPDTKVNRRSEGSKKLKRKSKQKAAQAEAASNVSGTYVDLSLVKDPLAVEISQVCIDKVEKTLSESSLGNQPSKEVPLKESSDTPKSKSSSPAASKKKNRKGGLSMFLSGALDDTPKEVVPPPTPKPEGPAWGGAMVSKGSASLRAIQDEQSKTPGKQSPKTKEPAEDHVESRSDGKLLLSSFITSKPIPVVSSYASSGPDAEKGTPPWASGTPPHLSRPSLRDIQMQQAKQNQNFSHSPKTRTAGFSIPSSQMPSSQGSPSDSAGMNRWFKPEVNALSSIRSIQIEEKAMKDLKRFYSSVKIVKNSS